MSQKATPEGPAEDSQAPKLMLITWAGTGEVSTRYCASASMPPLAAVDTTSRIDAALAILPARITSSVASDWSSRETVLVGGAVNAGPGSTPPKAVGTISVGLGKPVAVSIRKFSKSLKSVRDRPTIPIVLSPSALSL